MRNFLLTILTALMISPASGSQVLEIGGVPLQIGMKKADVLTLLNKNNIVKCLGLSKILTPTKCDFAITRGNPDTEDFRFLGSVYFNESELLRLVMKNYDNRQLGAKSADVISFLYEVLRIHAQNGENFASSIDETRLPGYINKSIFFRSEKRVISISYSEGNFQGNFYKPYTSMYETLE